jgi:hypothetical protein
MFDHEQVLLLLEIHFVLQLVSAQLAEDSTTNVVSLELKTQVGVTNKIRIIQNRKSWDISSNLKAKIVANNAVLEEQTVAT